MNKVLKDFISILQNSPIQEKVDATLEFFLHDTILPESVPGDNGKARQLLNNQQTEYYNLLLQELEESCKQSYYELIILWPFLLDSLTEEVYDTLIKLASKDSESEAGYFLNGFRFLNANSPEEAIESFTYVKNIDINFWIGLSYLQLGSFENATKSLEFIEENVELSIGDLLKQGIDMREGDNFRLSMMNLYMDLCYCEMMISAPEKAYQFGLKLLQYFPIVELYRIYCTETVQKSDKQIFESFSGNYLLSMEKTARYTDAIELVDFLISKNINTDHNLELRHKYLKLIQRHSGELLPVRAPKPPKLPFNIEVFQPVTSLSKERILEDLIVEQIKYGFQVFGRNMEIYNDKRIYGKQYYVRSAKGILDLLLVDKVTNEIYVVELKRFSAKQEIIQQVKSYMLGLEHELGRPIKGIICAHAIDHEIIKLVNDHPGIEAYSYEFNFTKVMSS